MIDVTQPPPTTEILGRLLLTAMLAGLIGMEREAEHKPAGFRTHVLVALGSACMTLVSVFMYYQYPMANGQRGDPSRIAAQVVSGIGFLGAGTIMRYGTTVVGLTTAASLWTVAGIGMAIAMGLYSIGLITTGLVMGLLLAHRLETYIRHSKDKILKIEAEGGKEHIEKVTSVLTSLGVEVRHLEMKYHQGEKGKKIMDLQIRVSIPSQMSMERIAEDLERVEGIFSVST